MSTVLPQNQRFLRDACGCVIDDGSCVVDPDGKVGYVRLEYGTRRGPDSPYWDGWFSVAPIRRAHPLSGKVCSGVHVRVVGAR